VFEGLVRRSDGVRPVELGDVVLAEDRSRADGVGQARTERRAGTPILASTASASVRSSGAVSWTFICADEAPTRAAARIVATASTLPLSSRATR